MEPMIIPRGFGEPPTLLVEGSLERSPKRKSAWIVQNVINSLFQQRRKKTAAVLAAEEPGCTARSASTATTPVKARDTASSSGDWAVPCSLTPRSTRADAVCTVALCAAAFAVLGSAADALTGRVLGSRTSLERLTPFKRSTFSPLSCSLSQFLWGRNFSSLVLVLMLWFEGLKDCFSKIVELFFFFF